MKATPNYLVLCCSEQWCNGLFYQMEPHGDVLRLDCSRFTSGAFCQRALDSGENGFVWSRVVVDALLPADSALWAYAYATDDPEWEGWTTLNQRMADMTGDPVQALHAVFGPPVASSTDFYLKCTGRYLWLAFELNAAGEVPPEIRRISLRMGGDHMTDYLPAIYREDDFTQRYLSVFDSILMDIERDIYALPRRIDFESADPEMLEYLASWVCIEGGGETDLRERIHTALPDYETMYTVEGIARSVHRLSGQTPMLIEHFSVDPNRIECRNPALYRRLYGEDPYRFFVLLPGNAFASRDSMERFLDAIELLIPAGTSLELVLLKKCVQLDWHTYLGINSMVGDYIPVAINENVTIHYDTTIGGANHE